MAKVASVIQNVLYYMRHKPDYECSKMTKEQEEDEVTCACGMLEARSRFLGAMASNPDWRQVEALDRIGDMLEKIVKDGITTYKGEV